MKRGGLVLFVLVLLGAAASQSFAAAVIYNNEAQFLSDLAALGYADLRESFEANDPWGTVRTTIFGGTHTAPSITAQGITWTSNNGTSEITTGEGPARTGVWGFFSLPHGNFDIGVDCHIPGNCSDGFGGQGAMTLYGVGAWLETNTPPAAVNFLLDGQVVNLGEDAKITNQHSFLGVIDTAGFTTFEINELEGTATDRKAIFADDFILAVPSAPVAALCDVKANGSDGPLAIAQGTPLSVTVSLDPSTDIGTPSDWWLVANSIFGWYYYERVSGNWLPGMQVTFQGALFPLPSTEVLNSTTLPSGSYTIHFGVDLNMNGVVDFDQISRDSVSVTIE